MEGSEGDARSTRRGRTCCTGLVVLFAGLFSLGSLAVSLTARIYLKGYYYTAHLSGVAAVLVLFVVGHHAIPVRKGLGMTKRAFSWMQCVLNLWYTCCPLVSAVAYAVLTSRAVNLNYDYVGALVWAGLGGVAGAYLLHRSYSSTQQHRHDCYKLTCPPVNGVARTHIIPLEGTKAGDRKSQTGSETSDTLWTPGQSRDPSSNNWICAKRCMRGCFWIPYVIFHILFMISVFLTAYEPWRVFHDIIKYREDTYMYTVSLPGHRPIALFLKCTGSGNDTILFENGLGGTFHMGWHFVPRFLSGKFKVCAYDRRGYGWSESLESDYIDAYLKEPQWTLNNIQFLRALIEEAKIPKPFFYVGHSYGGHHITAMAAKYPDLIKGLVFLDGAHFSPVQALRRLMEMAANFQPLGLLRTAIETNIIDYRRLFGSVIEFEALPTEMERTMLATFNSGLFFAANVRENGPLLWSTLARDGLETIIQDITIKKPVLVIDAGSRQSSAAWFPKQHFPFYRQNLHFKVENSTHQSLVYSNRFAGLVSNLIENFIDLYNQDGRA